ncbi:MAG: tRNA (adenosine(37)-N6)-threonylcarbamoyltransferase complex transferase subunit TsaD [Candidatus Kerfeldbacteria bacterium RIFCSPHIGHO2_12_FULL_48_17]|uniref:tRNA N6-adenosine threonylcarbamoyltransferase n=1 Tax=Candidatus Kerfeldbacteria bacterium RIFCSPHIGHO2_12_FULL_48_17 TaxID=1798542 RepID=A0A1G2B7F5_9BACT|nr:MAG: tRNA (adenosine(37)-N6)-threonylcarbamoyltransferase complex transferase subunit TsaD [Candidatus Kerfeldbacteria bacterium RIFCSPHIGHO2_12_FULL_48_17]
MPHILAIESSCDETAASVVSFSRRLYTNGLPQNIKVKSNVVATQIAIHQATAGVVPEVAAREHVSHVLPVIEEALAQAHVTSKKIDAIAVTTGPGLITSLMIGVETAKTLAAVWHKPLISMNHMEGHIAANFVHARELEFPALALVVSGGHTEIIFLPRSGQYTLVGRTRDDAAGEAFDKIAKLLGLEYPGGPIISRLAKTGAPRADLQLPRPMLDSGDFDFSFSGLKTAVYYALKKQRANTPQAVADMARATEEAIVDVLVQKTKKAAQKYKVKTILLAGGVAANQHLRASLENMAREIDVKFLKPEIALCTDNAAMIGLAATQHFLQKNFMEPTDVRVNPQWELV